MPSLLIVDDESAIRFSFRELFEEEDLQVLAAESVASALEKFRAHTPDVVVLDLQLPDGNGLDVFREIRTGAPQCPVIIITAYGTASTAIDAMKAGAFDYLVKPLNLEQLSQVLLRALQSVRTVRASGLIPGVMEGDRIIGHSAVMQEMCKAIGRLAAQDVQVLILGESGTGKELVARALHQHSRRADLSFLALNCAAIPDTLLESELFGHEPGAFTGAIRRRLGAFEQCAGGTLLFDEIGDMAPSVQAKLLRVLQEQRFQRVGGDETLQTNVRVLAATNQDLPGQVSAGRFRLDLLYRLNSVTIHVPSLRERREDIPELASFFLARFNKELGKDFHGFSDDALDLLMRFDWPGNVRQLQGTIKEAMLRASGNLVFPEYLPQSIRPAEKIVPVSTVGLDGFVETLLQSDTGDLHARAVKEVERILLPRVLQQTKGSQTQASDLLGISRNTLRQKLRSLDLEFERKSDDTGAF
jgi:two-component system nitrogen regulation response regulator GlnG